MKAPCMNLAPMAASALAANTGGAGSVAGGAITALSDGTKRNENEPKKYSIVQILKASVNVGSCADE